MFSHVLFSTYLLFSPFFSIPIGAIKQATHALVIMLGGIFTRWKIPVTHYCTPNDLNGAILKPIVENIIEKAESIGLLVHSVTTDMGAVNLAMWRAFGGIVCNKNTEIRYFIIHLL